MSYDLLRVTCVKKILAPFTTNANEKLETQFPPHGLPIMRCQLIHTLVSDLANQVKATL
jgi:hypothetical protein